MSHSNGHAPERGAAVCVDRRMELIEHFQCINLPANEGVEGPEKEEQFLHRLEMIFQFIGCNDAEKLILVKYHLQGKVGHWWEVPRGAAKVHYQGTS